MKMGVEKMKRIKRLPVSLGTKIERITNFLCMSLRIWYNKNKDYSLENPNTTKGWEKMCMTSINPITEIKSEIAHHLLKYTLENESMLEAGCGTASISAELAISNRKIYLSDFSENILKRATLLFQKSNLALNGMYCFDLTKPFPFSDNSFDVIWSSGVLEHWTEEELPPIITEMVRCAKRCVISLVPNERSVLYRFGREYSEHYGVAPWGREIPRTTLRHHFEEAGLVNIYETCVCLSMAPFLIGILEPVFSKKVRKWWEQIPESDPVKTNQGYLLFTIGYKKA